MNQFDEYIEDDRKGRYQAEKAKKPSFITTAGQRISSFGRYVAPKLKTAGSNLSSGISRTYASIQTMQDNRRKSELSRLRYEADIARQRSKIARYESQIGRAKGRKELKGALNNYSHDIVGILHGRR